MRSIDRPWNPGSRIAAVILLAALAVPRGAAAADEQVIRGIPSQQQLLNALDPTAGTPQDATPQVTTRAARPTQVPNAPSPATNVGAAPQTASASLLLLFQYNSAELTSKARRQLDAVAAALKSPKLGTYRFELQGHTDAAGGEEYNLALSQQRAQAVYDYLVHQHGIDPQRLTAIGVGEDDLLDSRNPMAEVNRRVKIINLGS